jgi:hypothetical protein
MIGVRVVFKYWTQPDCGTAQIFDVIDIVDDSLDRAPKGFLQFVFIAKTRMSNIEVQRAPFIAVVKPVYHKKVDDFLSPFPMAVYPIFFVRFWRKIYIVD